LVIKITASVASRERLFFYVNRDTDFLKGNSNPYHFYHLPSIQNTF